MADQGVKKITSITTIAMQLNPNHIAFGNFI
jgi:hypothetical protein